MRSSPAPLHSHAPSLSPFIPPSLAIARSLTRLGSVLASHSKASEGASERARASFHFASAPKETTVELGRLPFHVVTVVESAFNGHDSASEEPSLHPWGCSNRMEGRTASSLDCEHVGRRGTEEKENTMRFSLKTRRRWARSRSHARFDRRIPHSLPPSRVGGVMLSFFQSLSSADFGSLFESLWSMNE